MKRLGFLAGTHQTYVVRNADDADDLVLDVLAGHDDPTAPTTVAITIKVDVDGWVVVEHQRDDGVLLRGYVGMIDLDNPERPFVFNIEPATFGQPHRHTHMG